MFLLCLRSRRGTSAANLLIHRALRAFPRIRRWSVPRQMVGRRQPLPHLDRLKPVPHRSVLNWYHYRSGRQGIDTRRRRHPVDGNRDGVQAWRQRGKILGHGEVDLEFSHRHQRGGARVRGSPSVGCLLLRPVAWASVTGIVTVPTVTVTPLKNVVEISVPAGDGAKPVA